MKKRDWKKYLPVLLLLLFVALAMIIAIGVSRRAPIAPTAPVRPRAAVCLLEFTIAQLACNGICTQDAECDTGTVCYKTSPSDASGFCRNPSCLTATNCLCPTPVPGAPACSSKVAYRDVAGNTAGTYNLDAANQISSTATVSPGDKIVFALSGTAVSASTSADVVWSDVLDERFTYLDGSNCVSYNSSTRTVSCNKGIVSTTTNYDIQFRVQVNSTVTGSSIPNLAQITSEGAASSSCSLSLALAQPTPTPTPSPTPAITGGFFIRKYQDTNGNGTQNTGEQGLTWKFQWSQDNGVTWNDYETNGTKLGEGGVIVLPVGTKVLIREVAVSGWTSTTPTSVDLTIKQNDNQLMVFGNYQPVTLASPTPTPTPAPRCNSACVTSSDCPTSMNCVSGFCRNPSCATQTNCVCTVAAAPTPTPVPEELPKSGVIDDTLKLVGAGVGAIILGLIALLAL